MCKCATDKGQTVSPLLPMCRLPSTHHRQILPLPVALSHSLTTQTAAGNSCALGQRACEIWSGHGLTLGLSKWFARLLQSAWHLPSPHNLPALPCKSHRPSCAWQQRSACHGWPQSAVLMLSLADRMEGVDGHCCKRRSHQPRHCLPPAPLRVGAGRGSPGSETGTGMPVGTQRASIVWMDEQEQCAISSEMGRWSCQCRGQWSRHVKGSSAR